MARVNLHCPACGWLTSRAPRPENDYGPCLRCGDTVRRWKPRAVRPTPVKAPSAPEPSPFNQWYEQTYGDGHTWPELVAAELERREREAS